MLLETGNRRFTKFTGIAFSQPVEREGAFYQRQLCRFPVIVVVQPEDGGSPASGCSGGALGVTDTAF
jgi:hypothetical protein